MKKKSHDRSPDKKGFSVALPITLLRQIEEIAAKEHRSRNGQIEHLLDEAVKAWLSLHGGSIKPMIKDRGDNIIAFSEAPLFHAAAGLPIDSNEDTYTPDRDLGPGRFACKLHGHSMEPLYNDQSIVIMRWRESLRRPLLKKGEIYLFILSGVKTVKIYDTRPATKEEIESEIAYQSSSGSWKTRVLRSVNPEVTEIVIREDAEWIGWLDKSDN